MRVSWLVCMDLSLVPPFFLSFFEPYFFLSTVSILQGTMANYYGTASLTMSTIHYSLFVLAHPECGEKGRRTDIIQATNGLALLLNSLTLVYSILISHLRLISFL